MSAETSTRPRVGVPFRNHAEESAGKRQKYDAYLRSVREAGGAPVEISLALPTGELARIANTLDAIVLPGSPRDVDPQRYKATRHAKTEDADARREQTDFALLEHCFTERKPVLAICYGAQILNVCLGGTLYQDIEGDLHTKIRHSKDGLPPGVEDPVHPATIEPGGELGQLAAACNLEKHGGKFAAQINTSHHQSIRDVGHGLRVAAIAPDGVIEAVEHEPHKHWVVGVQWHPERMPGDALATALFRALVQAAHHVKA